MRCLLYSFSFPVHEISAKTCSSSDGHLGLQERVGTSLLKTLTVETCLQPALHLHSGWFFNNSKTFVMFALLSRSVLS